MNPLIKAAVRARFLLTSKQRCSMQSLDALDTYLRIWDQLDEQTASRCVQIPLMYGVDEDMREWSFFMLLEHNVIVNRSITARMKQLVLGEPQPALDGFDMKKDVMPSGVSGVCQVNAFKASIHEHLAMVATMGDLRKTQVSLHSRFGLLDAHKWNCMFAFHLKLHLKQAEAIAQLVLEDQ
jgi:hypothetical protein